MISVAYLRKRSSTFLKSGTSHQFKNYFGAGPGGPPGPGLPSCFCFNCSSR